MTRRSAATARIDPEMGPVTKVVRSPRDSSSARRMFSSSIGPRMKPRIRGAHSQPNLLASHPKTPNPIVIQMSKGLLLIE